MKNLLLLIASVAAIRIEPTVPVDKRPVINFEDAKRQEHTDTVIGHLGDRVFNHYHNDADEINENLKARPSRNHDDAQPEQHVQDRKLRELPENWGNPALASI